LEKVYNVTVNGKHDCVVMTELQALLVTLKFGKNIKIYDMTKRHGLKPAYLHKQERIKGRDMTKILYNFDELMEMKYD
jgi:hypothetical protein